jgi:hypothetical protein
LSVCPSASRWVLWLRGVGVTRFTLKVFSRVLGLRVRLVLSPLLADGIETGCGPLAQAGGFSFCAPSRRRVGRLNAVRELGTGGMAWLL